MLFFFFLVFLATKQRFSKQRDYSKCYTVCSNREMNKLAVAAVCNSANTGETRIGKSIVFSVVYSFCLFRSKNYCPRKIKIIICKENIVATDCSIL